MNNLFIIPIMFVLAFGFLAVGTEAQITTNITGTDFGDTYVKHDQANTNFGGSSLVVVRDGAVIQIPHFFLNISSLNAGSVSNATLYMWESNERNTTFNTDVQAYETTNQSFVTGFNENTLKWINGGGCYDPNDITHILKPECNLLSTTFITDSNGRFGWDVTSALQNAVLNDDVALVVMNTTFATTIEFESKEGGESGRTPYLEITYTEADPVPVITNVTTDPASPFMNPIDDFSNLTADFYATVTDNHPLTSVVMEINGNNNITATAVGDVYHVQTDLICNGTTPINDYRWFATDNSSQTTVSGTGNFDLQCMSTPFITFESFSNTPESPQTNALDDFSNVSVTFGTTVANNTPIVNVVLNLHGVNITATDTHPTYTAVGDVVCNATSPVNDYQWIFEDGITNTSSVFSYSLSCSPTPPPTIADQSARAMAGLLPVIFTIGGFVGIFFLFVKRQGRVTLNELILAIVGISVVIAGAGIIESLL